MNYDIKLERAILGACIIDGSAIQVAVDVLQPGMFYDPANQIIFAAMCDMHKANTPIDILTLSDALAKRKELADIGGASYLAEITNNVASSANLEYHCRVIAEKAIKRHLGDFGHNVVRMSADPGKDALAALTDAQEALYGVWSGQAMRGAQKIANAAAVAVDQANKALSAGGSVIGVTSGIGAIDSITGGWRNTDLVILAARPGMGKTSLALKYACEAATAGIPVGIFSLEMSSDQLATRMICMLAGVDSMRVRNGKMSQDDMRRFSVKADEVSQLPIFINDSASASIGQVRAEARRLKMRHGIGLLIVDYLQLMTASSDRGNREQEISEISRGLKAIAKEQEIPVIALSQLSRAVESRGGTKRPMLSDLRESGAIEQDADIVTFLYRPEYYGFYRDEEGADLAGVAELIFAKNRHGAIDTVRMQFHAEYTRFDNKKEEYAPF